jgi:hypothetical protein
MDNPGPVTRSCAESEIMTALRLVAACAQKRIRLLHFVDMAHFACHDTERHCGKPISTVMGSFQLG